MKALVISDENYQTPQYQALTNEACGSLQGMGFDLTTFAIGRDDLAFCMGCFGCWVKKPGECVIPDRMDQINRAFVASDVIIYISPIVFGQCSANIKNALDRWLPNMLPFFLTRSDGSTIHPSRYQLNPRVVIIGCGYDVSAEDAQLFMDIIKKHRNADVWICGGEPGKAEAFLKSIRLEKTGDLL